MRNGAENFRKRAQAGIFQKGFAVTLAEPVLSEMAGCAGYDFVFIDAEHAPLGRIEIFRHIMAAQGAGVCAFVRVPDAAPAPLKAILDAGPDGIIFPFVHNARIARAAVAACVYPDSPPRGMRGQGPQRAVRYGFGPSGDYLADPGAWCLRLMQIESLEGYLHLDEILAVDGVDGIYLGPADLLRSLRAAQTPPRKSVEEICRDVYARVRAAGKLMGAPLGTDVRSVESVLQMGAQWGVCGIDTELMAGAMRACLALFEGPADF